MPYYTVANPNVNVERGKNGLRDETYDPKIPKYDITCRNAKANLPGIFFGATNI